MPRERDPKRAEAKKLWLDSGGQLDLVEIAAQLNVSAGTIRGWKSKDNWSGHLNGTFRTDEGNAPNKQERSKGKTGAPKGNKNAVGNKGGAPPGSKNALGNKGGHGGPFGNKKAVTTGEHEMIWLDTLTEAEQQLMDHINTDPVAQADESIALLSVRERRMMQRIKNLMDGLTEKERSELQELKSIKGIGTVHDEKSGITKSVPVTRDEMVLSKVEEKTFRKLDDILKLEEALTRIQDKKIRAIELKNKLIAVDEEKQVRTEILRIELQKMQGAEGATASWTDAIREIAERRRASKASEQHE
ncbi:MULTISPECIES: phage terminase small subunit [Paenibacillus]|uniref:phage terminase small subunit n=1 Tax=Paenibacillus TaxID=44249 RepID=UPI00096ED24F|nr:phage terminase small subunit [Paenibacillus odorifer]OME18751.1 terminase [Paenibacillus odorifer]